MSNGKGNSPPADDFEPEYCPGCDGPGERPRVCLTCGAHFAPYMDDDSEDERGGWVRYDDEDDRTLLAPTTVTPEPGALAARRPFAFPLSNTSAHRTTRADCRDGRKGTS